MTSKGFKEFYLSSGLCTDTRAIVKDCLFVCIRGENFNGNTFSKEALAQGANHVIVDNPDHFTNETDMTLVEDSVKYIQQLANHHRRKFDIPVIGITGSNGKTTTKELMHAVLSKKYNVLSTIGNLNNHLGVPFTVLRLESTHDIAIIEMGANRLNDIQELCEIVEPTHGIITNIGKAHLEGFGDFAGVLKTKRELYEAIDRVSGTIVMNSDDKTLVNALPQHMESFDYGTSMRSEVFGQLLSLSPFVNLKWENETYRSTEIRTQMVGKYNFYNYLAAISFGVLFEVPSTDISNAISEYTPRNNRSQIQKTSSNTLIMDCYNANPTSMRSALDSFAMIENDSKLFILGDMKELGAESDSEHSAIIRLIESLGLSGYTVGSSFAKLSSDQVLESFTTTEELKAFLSANKLSDHLLLLKGSRSVGLESVTELL